MTPTALTPHILSALAAAQVEGTPMTLESLTFALAVRRTDVRAAVSALHEQGLVDALRMRLTLSGFALGQALRSSNLPPLRQPILRLIRAA